MFESSKGENSSFDEVDFLDFMNEFIQFWINMNLWNNSLGQFLSKIVYTSFDYSGTDANKSLVWL